jgi:hypothetical protein
MSLTTYGTRELLGVVETLQPIHTYWLDLCFPQTMTFESEEIFFDAVDRGKRMAPFVSPLVGGKPMVQEGYTTKSFKPAYVKPKDIVDPMRAIKRRAGEMFNGELSLQQRFDAAVADVLKTQMDGHKLRQEWMAAQAVINGSVVVAGEAYPSQTVDFGRAAGQTITLGAGVRWSDAVDVLVNLQTWAMLMLRAGSPGPFRVTMGADALTSFLGQQEVKDQLNTQVRGTAASLNTVPVVYDGAYSVGTIGQYEIWGYNDRYQDETGAWVDILGAKEIVMTSQAIAGVRCFGAIRDVGAMRATEMYPKMWEEQDPSAMMMMTQSAPLMVPTRPNASLKATVLA